MIVQQINSTNVLNSFGFLFHDLLDSGIKSTPLKCGSQQRVNLYQRSIFSCLEKSLKKNCNQKKYLQVILSIHQSFPTKSKANDQQEWSLIRTTSHTKSDQRQWQVLYEEWNIKEIETRKLVDGIKRICFEWAITNENWTKRTKIDLLLLHQEDQVEWLHHSCLWEPEIK
jgi:hypothetical protein